MQREELNLGDVIIYDFEDSVIDDNGNIVDKTYILAGIVTDLTPKEEYGRPSITVQDLKVLRHWNQEDPFSLEQGGVCLTDITEIVGNALDPIAEKYPELVI